ncbi:cation efflux family [Zalerion maritima]|uniref:Cation efflux family n=1 Tax=Zalerion maritima TaxID=339359 RepID=A0AAD5RZC8_9PEZI|nr:cation efflux family [Zalerion maritima]
MAAPPTPPTAQVDNVHNSLRQDSDYEDSPSFVFTVTNTEEEEGDDAAKRPQRCELENQSWETGLLDLHHSPPLTDALSDDCRSMAGKENEGASPTITTSPDFAAAATTSPVRNPFNFETKIISPGPVKPQLGQRRGHRYKHSSISTQHQIFQGPPSRPPLVLPASLPIPTFREAWKSMQKEQYHRVLWCLCHIGIAFFAFLSSQGSLAMTALSHLVLFDAASGLVTIGVDVLGNFEAWRRSSVRHPFGLERAEVLAGFAMSVFLLFGGFDLISHDAKHALESMGDHAPHHPHVERVGKGSVDFAALAAVLATLVSAYGMKNQARIARLLRVGYLAALPAVLRNPFHFLTLSFSGLLLLLPLLSMTVYSWVDRLVCLAIAGCMFVLGVRLTVAQGLMLLMSYSDYRGGAVSVSAAAKGQGEKENEKVDVVDSKGGVSAVMREIEGDSAVIRLDDAQFWQVHYGLGVASMKLCVSKSNSDDASLSKLRQRVSQLVQNRLGEGYGRGGGLRWDVTVEIITEDTS